MTAIVYRARRLACGCPVNVLPRQALGCGSRGLLDCLTFGAAPSLLVLELPEATRSSLAKLVGLRCGGRCSTHLVDRSAAGLVRIRYLEGYRGGVPANSHLIRVQPALRSSEFFSLGLPHCSALLPKLWLSPPRKRRMRALR